MSKNAIFTLALAAGLVMLGTDAFAEGAAASGSGTLYTTARDLVVGNLGLFLGLLLAVWGIWTWVVKQETMAGILMIAGGVLITIAPGVMNFMSSIVNPIVDLGSSSRTDVQGANEKKDFIGIHN